MERKSFYKTLKVQINSMYFRHNRVQERRLVIMERVVTIEYSYSKSIYGLKELYKFMFSSGVQTGIFISN